MIASIQTREEEMQGVCLDCGMSFSAGTSYCPKCDNALDQQHDGSTITVDIAHGGETVREALRKMENEVDMARKDVATFIRLIVGSGRIRDEVLLALRDLRFRGDVQDFDLESSNGGSVLVRLK